MINWIVALAFVNLAGLFILGFKILDEDNIKKNILYLIILIFSILSNAVIFFLALTVESEPKPIDVYRNKTMVVIDQKIENGVVTEADTTIVWK